MLEQLQAEAGKRYLEIGAAVGFNAALLACFAGPGGAVVTIEFDGALADQASQNLRRAGYPGVRVITGDDALGHEEEAPCDGIIVTARLPFSRLGPVAGRRRMEILIAKRDTSLPMQFHAVHAAHAGTGARPRRSSGCS